MTASPLFITCPRGVEPLLAAELQTLGATELHERAGGVSAQADARDVYRICLWSRLASRVLRPLAECEIDGADDLYTTARAIDWPALFDPHCRFAITIAGSHPTINNTHFAALRVKDAVVDGFRAAGLDRPSIDTHDPDIRLHLHLGKTSNISLDLAGESLHRRGYRVAGATAPLKENLACAILARCGWPAASDTEASLLDPMCGSGTLVIEAALMAFDIAPGLARRKWGFAAWREHQPELWNEVHSEALARKQAGLSQGPINLHGSDLDNDAISAARANARRAGLSGKVDFEVSDALSAAPRQPAGLLVCNLPYGERLSNENELIRLYSLFGAHLKTHFADWRCALFTSRTDLTPRLGLRAEKIHRFFNGAIECSLLQFPPISPGSEHELAPDLANRLRKNLKHLNRWARRNGISCYRLYDADLPDYAVAMDLYQTHDNGLHVHVQEYAAPKTIDPIQAEKRLRAALATTLEVLDLSPDHLHYKLRHAQKGSHQYQANAGTPRRFTIDEHGCRLLVDFESYLDTGLFLDHRPIRLRIQQESHGKRVLNLFCYTGSATAQAVRGGALRTVSLDLSNTYLEWARDNLAANGAGAELYPHPPRDLQRLVRHALIHADARKWLAEAAAQPQGVQFDLVFIDPPTFSNSKAMEGHFDIQRDHAPLIDDAMKLLAPEGSLYFSSNRRRFKLDQTLAERYSVQDITPQTLDEDFKRPRPAHRCWKITHRSAPGVNATATGAQHAAP
ncbi:MAG TPA: bifunctional 23S rRNA (guanine(2069)-N(7))-methyltransferase RlmK/23S rRNA (guanine(2445)-N(2))-methyltransferase RlmL [Nevskiaceae bacterium]|nr:bifunctional 23S rRNA (guanine(2069)-N(7))-methyltransferase RlmK/23S rRNA (guanine(2445)-N(2))-methyltransferase RlmL [Nevskiaceae bacterium]